MIILDKFRCKAVDLTHPALNGWTLFLRLEDDPDEPALWHQVRTVGRHGFRTDTGQPFVKALTVAFHDGTPDMVLNETDEVEFAVPRPVTGIPGAGS
jgi:hypothetical protein